MKVVTVSLVSQGRLSETNPALPAAKNIPRKVTIWRLGNLDGHSLSAGRVNGRARAVGAFHSPIM